MKIAILSANLGNFDTPVDPIEQELPEGVTDIVFHRFTDTDFPPIADMQPRFQYRIPKLFGYEMFPGYDLYIWMDASMTFKSPHAVKWLLKELADNDIAFFKHPWRHSVEAEVKHIEDYLQIGNEYITKRYGNGLHKEALKLFREDEGFVDDKLYASTVFVYRPNELATDVLSQWWYYQSRYYTCDQVALPFATYETPEAKVKMIEEHVFRNSYFELVSHHK